ncbi:MAG: UDP-N-acetylmuramoyl-tripeptide--D-alanyl-D-alanine ligase [Acidobacteriota bacterium]
MPGRGAYLYQQLRERVLQTARTRALPLAAAYRKSQRETRFIGVTGSCGKTTTKFLIQAVLASRHSGVASPLGRNREGGMLRTIFRVRHHHRFCLIELGAFGPGTLDPLLRTMKPEVGVVTNVGSDHLSAFGSVEEVAREKGKLTKSLPCSGWAILNGDDPRVRQMAADSEASVLFYGCGQGNELTAKDVSSRWPERLSFSVTHEGRDLRVHTRLCGEQWVYAVLAALAVGLTMGIPLDEGIEAVANVAPFARRVQPFMVGRGIAWIRDDWKASSWTVPLALKFLGDARARRRIFALGHVSDDRMKPRRLYPRFAREARQVADQVCLFGKWAHHGLRARAGDEDPSILAFPSATALVRYLEKTLEPGDLLYVKASGRKDPTIDTAFSGVFWEAAISGPQPCGDSRDTG